jgi:hypothetical protein
LDPCLAVANHLVVIEVLCGVIHGERCKCLLNKCPGCEGASLIWIQAASGNDNSKYHWQADFEMFHGKIRRAPIITSMIEV